MLWPKSPPPHVVYHVSLSPRVFVRSLFGCFLPVVEGGRGFIVEAWLHLWRVVPVSTAFYAPRSWALRERESGGGLVPEGIGVGGTS